MKTELKDIIHFYLGAKCLAPDPYGQETESQYIITQVLSSGVTLQSSEESEGWTYAIGEIKPILRPLSDMTEEEINYVGLVLKEGTWNAPDIRSNPKMAWGIHHLSPNTFAYLLKQGFDLFGLIESGQAIDKTTLTNLF